MSKQPQSAPTASAIGPCPTIIQIVGRPGTGSLPRAIEPPDHPQREKGKQKKKDSPPESDRRSDLKWDFRISKTISEI